MARAQAHTLEAVAAGTIMLASIVFALQVTAVTPLTASTASQHIENQQTEVIEGILAGAEHNETLKPTLLFVNDSSGQFYNTTYKGMYTQGGPPTEFGATLNRTFEDQGIAFNVRLNYVTSGGQQRTHDMVHMGVPSDNAVVRTSIVTLYDDDPLYHRNASGDMEARNVTVGDVGSSGFYAPPLDGPVYNVIQVEVTVWRM